MWEWHWTTKYTGNCLKTHPCGNTKCFPMNATVSSSTIYSWEEVPCSQCDGEITGYIVEYKSREQDCRKVSMYPVATIPLLL